MTVNFIIDSHEDLAFESLYGRFDYTRPISDDRVHYKGPEKFQRTVGWPEMQKARVGIVFGTVFISPQGEDHSLNKIGETAWETLDDFHKAVSVQLDFYDRLCEMHPQMFRRIFSRTDYDAVVQMCTNEQEYPVGLIGLLEGAEGLRTFDDLALYQNRGIHLVGPVWGGGRWCAGTKSREMRDALTDDGKALLRKMSELHLVLDISHMKNRSAMDSLQYFDGVVIASHANCNVLLEGMPIERHLNDDSIRMLIEHDGVMGVIPYNDFLSVRWMNNEESDRRTVTLNTLADHIDHICQLAGDSRHAAIGTDFDGGFGYPRVTYELKDISDLQKLEDVLQRRGFTSEDIANVFHNNWQRILERILK